MIKYCLPIINSSKQAVHEMISNNFESYDHFEVWLDYIDGLDPEFVEDLINKYQSKLILLFRRQNLEDIRTAIELRQDLLRLMSQREALIDLDVSAQQTELNFIRENNLSLHLIASYHNYHVTPSDSELDEKLSVIDSYNSEIVKISTMCQNPEDALRLMSLERKLSKASKKHIVLGMGSFGHITRVFATLWGNEMVFAPLSAENESAYGQLTRQQLSTIFENLGE